MPLSTVWYTQTSTILHVIVWKYRFELSTNLEQHSPNCFTHQNQSYVDKKQITESAMHNLTSQAVVLRSWVTQATTPNEWQMTQQILLYLHLAEEFCTKCSGDITWPAWKLIYNNVYFSYTKKNGLEALKAAPVWRPVKFRNCWNSP